MREFVQSLHRLYIDGKVTERFVRTLFSSKKLTKEELEYVLNSLSEDN